MRALGDTCALAAQSAQIIQLGATHLAAAHELDRVDHRRVQREHALHAFAVRDLADREALVESAARAADADALIGLNAGALAFDDLDVDDHGVARLEVRNLASGGQFFLLLFLELLNEVHGNSPSAACPKGLRRAAPSRLFVWVGASFYDKARGLSPRHACGGFTGFFGLF